MYIEHKQDRNNMSADHALHLLNTTRFTYVSLDTLFGTKGFARGSAIDIGDECGIGISKCVH
jgi:hypothetical protein